ncbi:MAG: hypothetical protein E7447_00170 [Ruminococcaceae bacterium]|nr:hypothetical protein [Oscillospiraceae bacterium]
MGNTMKLWISWAAAFALCTICGLIPTGESSVLGLFVMLLGMAFFIPPALLIRYVVSKKRTTPLVYVRNISLLSLGLTLIMIILNLATYNASEPVQLIARWLLALVYAPMGCLPDQIWFLSLFGWACVLMASLQYLQKQGPRSRRHRKHHTSSDSKK